MKTAITIGNFDGVHRGHRALVERINLAKRIAASKGDSLKTVVLTFEPHPIEILKPGTFVKRLSPAPVKIKLLESLGVDEVRVIPFTPALAQMTARDFFEKFLIAQLNPAFIAIGPNFYFGHGREGTPQLLKEWAQAAGIHIDIVERIEADGAPISSSRIRKLIEEGHMVGAGRLLGRDYAISGEVAHGAARGRGIGFPTANIVPQIDGSGAPCLPAKGVYLTFSTLGAKTFASVTNVGVKPTVQNTGPLVIETHILDQSLDLYGKTLTVEFRDRLRDEKKFNNLEELKAQILKDTELARTRLRNG
jgi:riboflavin kinase / FMN adenylyltransferase